ncbi:MAG TPA: FHA domain-containing protein [Terriglobales bacterium]|jgi:pSer/pThr/pTyr-binding forkhead associated (FHA) protein|nr:FHA domain-containing protein [Terriglobales bacterium]
MEILLSIRSKTDGSVRELKQEIASGVALGRGAEHGILLDGQDLSREHVVLTTDGDRVFVTDLSSNGTWLNGKRLTRLTRSAFRVGDSVDIPGYTLSYRLEEPPPPPEPAKAPEAPAPLPSIERQVVVSPPEPIRPAPRGNPVFAFIGSFSFGEKFLILVGLGGLLLIYTYAGL